MRFSILLFTFLSVSAIAKAQEPSQTLSLVTAQKIISACLACAESNKLNLTIAIYNREAQLVAFARMNNSHLGASKIAQWKGTSAATYRSSTAETGKWNVITAPDIATIPGGLPIRTKEGVDLGGVGVSGASSDDDVKCALAGLNAVGYSYPVK